MSATTQNTVEKILGYAEVREKPKDLVVALFAEFVGTLFLVLVGCGACVNWRRDPESDPDIVQIALAFGVTVATMVQCIGHVSGGHINPAVTCGMLVAGKISLLKAVLYVIFQSLGGMTGAGVLKGLTPEKVQEHGLGVTSVTEGVDLVQGLGVEFFITFVLIFVVFGVCDSNRNDVKGSAPLAIGLAVATCHLFAVNYTGSSMNPARSLGPAVATGKWDDHWIYWLGPCVGGMTAGILYQFIFSAKPLESGKDGVYFMHLKQHDGEKDQGAAKGLMPDTCC